MCVHKELRYPSQYSEWATDLLTGVHFKPGTVTGFLSPHHHIWNGCWAYPAPYPMNIRGPLHRVKRPSFEADHAPPSSSKIKSSWSCISNASMLSWHGNSLSTLTTLPQSSTQTAVKLCCFLWVLLSRLSHFYVMSRHAHLSLSSDLSQAFGS
jgi:hypothetical protein